MRVEEDSAADLIWVSSQTMIFDIAIHCKERFLGTNQGLKVFNPPKAPLPIAPRAQPARPGTVRHSSSTLLRLLQVDLKIQRVLLRRSNIRTRMNIYTQAVPGAMRGVNTRVVEVVLAKRKME